MTISRSDVKGFPYFFNHKSARLWLKEKYGRFLVLNDVDYRDNKKVYFYHFVKDRERYLEWKDKKYKFLPVDDSLYRDTFQQIEITESGKFRAKF